MICDNDIAAGADPAASCYRILLPIETPGGKGRVAGVPRDGTVVTRDLGGRPYAGVESMYVVRDMNEWVDIREGLSDLAYERMFGNLDAEHVTNLQVEACIAARVPYFLGLDMEYMVYVRHRDVACVRAAIGAKAPGDPPSYKENGWTTARMSDIDEVTVHPEAMRLWFTTSGSGEALGATLERGDIKKALSAIEAMGMVVVSINPGDGVLLGVGWIYSMRHPANVDITRYGIDRARLSRLVSACMHDEVPLVTITNANGISNALVPRATTGRFLRICAGIGEAKADR